MTLAFALHHSQQTPPAKKGLLQRKCSCGSRSGGGECTACKKKKKRDEVLQRCSTSGAPLAEIPSLVHNVLDSPGTALDSQTRVFMQDRFARASHGPELAVSAGAAVQHKLQVAAARDRYELEADRVAAQVASTSRAAAPPTVSASGGYDFSGVRVHADSRAAEAAESLNARAFAVGNHIVFGAGEFNQASRDGVHLLAHELTHVVQQGANGVRRAHRLAQFPELPAGDAGTSGSAPNNGLGFSAHSVKHNDNRGGTSSRQPQAGDSPGHQPVVQRLAVDGQPVPKVPPPVHHVFRSPGRELDRGTRGFMEQAFAREFPNLGVHSGGTKAGVVQRQEKSKEKKTEPAAKTQKDQAPAATTAATPKQTPAKKKNWCKPMHVAGQQSPKDANKIVRIAWTLDDGPRKFISAAMRKELGPRRGTWFIMRNRLPRKATDLHLALASLKKQQDEQGQEFAIHSFHANVDHSAWFPVKLGSAVAKGYARVDLAMKDLRSFVQVLRSNGLNIKFVRLPGGLSSEMGKYLKDRGVRRQDEDTARGHVRQSKRRLQKAMEKERAMKQQLSEAKTKDARLAANNELRKARDARKAEEKQLESHKGTVRTVLRQRGKLISKIVRDEDVAKLTPKETAEILGETLADTKQKDVQQLVTQATPVQRDYRLIQRTLAELGLKLWGGSGKGQQMTSPQSWQAESSGTGLTDDVTTKFREKVEKVGAGGKPESLVVLAHDMYKKNVQEVGRDIRTMERMAKEKGVRVEYYTMSGLYRCLREEEP